MFENKQFEGIYYSRFIASWYNVGGKRIHSHVDSDKMPNEFVRWLKQIHVNDKSMSDDVIYDIVNLATNGKLEIEVNAAHFMQ
jgi:hypothetical protein